MGEIFVIDQLLQNELRGRSIYKPSPHLLTIALLALMVIVAIPAYFGRYSLFSIACGLIGLVWLTTAIVLFAVSGIDIPFVLPFVAFSVLYTIHLYTLEP